MPDAGVSPATIAFAGFILTLIVTVFGFSRHVSGTADALRKEFDPKLTAVSTRMDALSDKGEAQLDALKTSLAQSLVSLRTEYDLKIQNVQNLESKARHDLSNAHQASFSKLDNAMAGLARKEDLMRLEATMRDVSAPTPPPGTAPLTAYTRPV